jgi:hypothetical protein
MEIDPKFLEAQIHLDREFMGRPARPFSLARMAGLMLIREDFLDVAPTPVEMLQAVRIFTMEVNSIDDAARILRKKLSLTERGIAFFLSFGFGYKKLFSKINTYVEDYVSVPQKDSLVNSKSKEVRTPFLNYLACFQRMRFGMTKTEAWNVPVGEALWDLETANEIETGDSLVMTTDEVELYNLCIEYKKTDEYKAKMKEQAADPEIKRKNLGKMIREMTKGRM